MSPTFFDIQGTNIIVSERTKLYAAGKGDAADSKWNSETDTVKKKTNAFGLINFVCETWRKPSKVC